MRLALMISAVLLLAVTLAVSGCCADFGVADTWTNNATVQSKFIDPGTKDSGSFYVIVTDKGQFEIDRPGFFNYNKSQNPDMLYGMIEVNHTYNLHHCGWYTEIDYNYPIVYEIQEVS